MRKEFCFTKNEQESESLSDDSKWTYEEEEVIGVVSYHLDSIRFGCGKLYFEGWKQE